MTYLKADLLKLKEEFTAGTTLKGQLTISGLRLDYFGEAGSPIEKLFFRGKNVLGSKKLDSIITILVKDLKDKYAGISWHSIAFVYTQLAKTQRLAVDKFGNLRGDVDTLLVEIDALSSICEFIDNYTLQTSICPLRREENDDVERV
jgi:hypothetical protein